jgi:hypothetical protein
MPPLLFNVSSSSSSSADRHLLHQANSSALLLSSHSGGTSAGPADAFPFQFFFSNTESAALFALVLGAFFGFCLCVICLGGLCSDRPQLFQKHRCCRFCCQEQASLFIGGGPDYIV